MKENNSSTFFFAYKNQQYIHHEWRMRSYVLKYFLTNNSNCISMMTCARKVHLLHHEKNLIGYIVNETSNRWKVQIEGKIKNSRFIWIPILNYSVDLGRYQYKKQSKSSDFIVKQYSPIRFLVNTNGMFKYTLNRLHFGENNQIDLLDSS